MGRGGWGERRTHFLTTTAPKGEALLFLRDGWREERSGRGGSREGAGCSSCSLDLEGVGASFCWPPAGFRAVVRSTCMAEQGGRALGRLNWGRGAREEGGRGPARKGAEGRGPHWVPGLGLG